ncbi:MAG: DeoR/GlpR family DNA-binding transcription regulator [Faecousia sp.]
MKESRRKQIEALVARRQSLTMQELCDIFEVSMNTIRSDVASLVKAGVVEKVYGGIRVKERKEIPLFTSRTMLHPDRKQAIAQAAEALIDDGDIVYIDAGTTTMHLIDCLQDHKHVTIVTPSLPIIVKAYEKSNVNLVILPGMYNRRTNAILDGSTAEYLTRYQHTKAFMGVSALLPNGALGVSSYLEYELKRTAVAQSQKAFLLADSSKLGEAGLLTYGTVEQMSLILTDRDMPDSFVNLCREKGTVVERL